MTVPEYAEAILWRAASPNGAIDVIANRPETLEYVRALDALHMARAAGLKAEPNSGGRYKIPAGSWLLRDRETCGARTVRALYVCRSGDLAKAKAKRLATGALRSIPQLFEILGPSGSLWARCNYQPGCTRMKWEYA